MPSWHAPRRDSLRLQLNSVRALPYHLTGAMSSLYPLLLSPDLTIQKSLWGCEEDGWATAVTQGRLTYGWWMTMRMRMRMREGRKEWLRVILLKSFTANHTRDWFPDHSVLLTHFSYHTSYSPISPFHQGQMKGTMACTPHSGVLQAQLSGEQMGSWNSHVWRWAWLR